jgi:hypothetical protein
MAETSGTAVCRAYATRENADHGGSRFVGPVELRGARGRVWLHGRRIPARYLWAHAGGRATGVIWGLAWRAVWGWVFGTWETWDTAGGDRWYEGKTRLETVSWPVAKSRMVLSAPVAQTRPSYSDATLPARMGVRGVPVDKAMQALEKALTSASYIQLEVPLGRRGGMTQLYLEVAGEQLDTVRRVLSGA